MIRVALDGRLRLKVLAHLLLSQWVHEAVRRLVWCIVLACDVLAVLLLFTLLLVEVLLLDSLVVATLSLRACVFHLRLLLICLLVRLIRLQFERFRRWLELAALAWTWTARRRLFLFLVQQVQLPFLLGIFLILQFLAHDLLQLHFLSLVDNRNHFGNFFNW